MAFTVARTGVENTALPLPDRLVQTLLAILTAGFALGCIGVLVDSRRRLSFLALAILLPALTIIGVLDGHS